MNFHILLYRCISFGFITFQKMICFHMIFVHGHDTMFKTPLFSQSDSFSKIFGVLKWYVFIWCLNMHMIKCCKTPLFSQPDEMAKSGVVLKCYVFIWFLNTLWNLILSSILKLINFWVWGLIIIKNKDLGFRV